MSKFETKKKAMQARRALERTGELTQKQVDMVVTAILAMPESVAAGFIKKLEQNPAGAIKEIRMPAGSAGSGGRT